MGLRPGQLLIAEVKTRSPFGWESEHSWDELFEIADQYGDMVSVHTDPRWGGSFELLAKARARTNKRILAKGIHESDELIEEALARDADEVLVVGRIPGIEVVRKCLVEPNDLQQLQGFEQGIKIVWNSRDLRTGSDNSVPFDQVRQIRAGWLCQASNIKTVDDVHPEANAVLVGSHLPEFVKTL